MKSPATGLQTPTSQAPRVSSRHRQRAGRRAHERVRPCRGPQRWPKRHPAQQVRPCHCAAGHHHRCRHHRCYCCRRQHRTGIALLLSGVCYLQLVGACRLCTHLLALRGTIQYGAERSKHVGEAIAPDDAGGCRARLRLQDAAAVSGCTARLLPPQAPADASCRATSTHELQRVERVTQVSGGQGGQRSAHRRWSRRPLAQTCFSVREERQCDHSGYVRRAPSPCRACQLLVDVMHRVLPVGADDESNREARPRNRAPDK